MAYSLLVDVCHQPEVYSPHAMADDAVDGGWHVAFFVSPELGKVVEHSVRYDSKRNAGPLFYRPFHKAVDGFVKCRVASHHDYCLIAIVDKHSDQPGHTLSRFALHQVVSHPLLSQYFFQSLKILP